MAAMQAAYVLHRRPFKDNKLLLDLLTLEQGLVKVVARAGFSRSGQLQQAQLQPFTPLLVSLGGLGKLVYLSHSETISSALPLAGEPLFSAFYINELLSRLLTIGSPNGTLFFQYQEALTTLVSDETEPVLRTFEFRLLQSLGFGISFTDSLDSGPISKDSRYQLHQNQGFRLSETTKDSYLGEQLLMISQENYIDNTTRVLAKKLSRQLLSYLLGDKPLKSRQLIQQFYQGNRS